MLYRRKKIQRISVPKPGVIKTVDGRVIGKHDGLMYYTLGQRKGLGIGGTRGGNGNEDPWYVVDKDLKHNVLVVAQGGQHPLLMSSGLIAYKLNWVDLEPLKQELTCTVKTRYRQKDINCRVIPLDNDQIRIEFDHPVAAVTPGQSAVLYSGDVCLGGGTIKERIKITDGH